MRVAIMGAGGIGGYFGARLANAGEEVSFIGRGAHLRAMQQDGLSIKSPLGDIHLTRVRATHSAADIGTVDVVVFAVKLYDIESAAAAISPIVGPRTRVITFQNGIDSMSILEQFFSKSQVVGGATYVSAYIDQPGHIVHLGSRTKSKVGGQGDPLVEKFEDACVNAGGLDIEIVEDINAALWAKFVTLSAFSGATSLMRSGVGPIMKDPESRIFVQQLLDEGMAVAAAAGHPMPAGFEAQVASIWGALPPHTKSSMANDLLRGKPIEVIWLSGRMHELGNRLGVPTPAHTAVFRALHLHAGGAREISAEAHT
jgi:2-dehydropantoate 2-reductase